MLPGQWACQEGLALWEDLVILDLKENLATEDHRVPGVFRVVPALWEKQARGDATEPTAHEACQESREARGTVVTMGSLVFLERRGTEESLDLRALQDHQERTAREVKMDRSGRGVWLERAVLEVCWAQEDLPVLLDSAVFLGLTAKPVPKETRVHREREAHPDSRASQAHKVSSVLKAQSDRLEKKDLEVNRVCMDWLVLMVLLVTQEKKDLPGRKVESVILVLWDPSATQDPAV